MVHAQEFQESERLILRARLSVKGQRQQHIFQDGQGGNQVEVLKNISEGLPPDLCQFTFRKMFRVAEDWRPSEVKFPEVGLSRQPRRLTSVVLPEPEGPMIEMKSPLLIWRETFI